MKRILALILCFLLLPCSALGELTIYFIDVGQGDSALIVCDGDSMIIDGGISFTQSLSTGQASQSRK